MMAVLNPEPGIWSAEVSGAVSSDSYSLSVLGTTATPQITVSDPSYSGMLVDTSVTVSGTAFANNGTLGTLTVYASNDNSSFNGVAVGTTTPQANGSFTVQVDTSSLIDGEYWLFAGIRLEASAPERRAYAPGSINVLHYQPLAAVTDFVAGENKAGGIDLHFTDPNGTRTLGFNLHVKDVTSGEASTIYMGHLTDTSLPGLTAGHTYQLQVGAKDAANREGALSQVITLAMGSVKQPINDFTIGANQLDAALKIGEVTQGTLTVNTVSATTANSAYDYVIANVVSTPAGLNLGFTAPVWNLSGGNASVGYTLYPQENVAPGSYLVVLALTNQGNASETHQVTIPVTVGYPKVTVTQVSPTRWNTEKAQVVDVYGTNFFSGTRVFIETTELTVTAVDTGHLQANAPAGLAAGTHTITVMGPGSDTATATVTLLAPDYQILAYKSMTVVQPGGSSGFFFTIQALNDFTGTVTFSLQDIPSGWSAALDRSTLAAGELATVSVTVPSGAAEGTSTLNVVTSVGDVLPLDVTVSATKANPTISGLSESAGFVGDSVSIYGYGFGTNATAMLGTTALPITTRGVDVITVQIPQDAASGDITVVRDGMVSNAVPFYVKSLGFTIYPDAKSLTMQPGESRTINLWVSGYAQAVGLSASTNDGNVSAHLAGTQVIPNGSVALTIEAPSSAAKGSYPVTITGVSGNVTNTAVITVSVGAAFSIDTTVLPNGMEGVDYLAQMKTSDGTEPFEMSIDSGRLPYGLTLESDGTISGRPSETGTLRFTLRAVDGDGRNRTQALSITVTENAWAQDAKDGGRTRFNPVPSLAD
jgi:hypothetical protein